MNNFGRKDSGAENTYPDAIVLAHPECKSTVLKLADVVGSTAALLKYAVNSRNNGLL